MNKTALISGVLGQDASFLAEQLLCLGYEVIGVYKRTSSGTRFDNVKDTMKHSRFRLVEGDITDSSFMTELIRSVKPTEFYSLAAQSHVGVSFTEPLKTFQVNAEAIIIQLEAIRLYSPQTRYYQASTSEMLGGLACPEAGYDEASPFNPRSPYAVAKAAAFYAVTSYRQSYNIHASNGILFNHSSTRRPIDFATRKITNGVAKCKLGLQDHIHMGNLEACRDEGHSADYTMAMHLMLQQSEPSDYVVATGVSVSIREMFEYVCNLAELKLEDVYREDVRFMRPSDVPYLKGNSSKIRKLGWEPVYSWQMLLKEMYEHDLHSLSTL